MEEKNVQEAWSCTAAEETLCPETAAGERSGKRNKKRAALAVAAVLLAAAAGAAVFAGRDRGASEALPARAAAEAAAPLTAAQSEGIKPGTLAAAASDSQNTPADSLREEPERKFRDGDYSGLAGDNGKDADGMGLPETGEGETLYIGYADLPQVGMTKVALVLSGDGKCVHDITVLLKDFDKDLADGSLSGITSVQTSNSKEFELPVKDQTLGDSTLLEISARGEYIYLRMDFSFKLYLAFGSDTKLIHLGETELWLKKAG